MKAGRPTPELLLTDEERETLRAWTRKAKCPQARALRARLILLCADGFSNTDAAASLHITIQTAGKWRQRFLSKRLDGLLDEPRPGTPRRLSEADVDRVLGLTLESKPAKSLAMVDTYTRGGQRTEPGQCSSNLESLFVAASPRGA